MYKGSLTNTDSIPPLHMYYKQRQNEWYFRKNTWKHTHIHWTDFNLYNASHLGVRHLNITEVASTVSAIQISYKRFTKNKTKPNKTHTLIHTHNNTKTIDNIQDFFLFKSQFDWSEMKAQKLWIFSSPHLMHIMHTMHFWLLCIYIRHNGQSVKLPGQVQNPQTLKSWLQFFKDFQGPGNGTSFSPNFHRPSKTVRTMKLHWAKFLMLSVISFTTECTCLQVFHEMVSLFNISLHHN